MNANTAIAFLTNNQIVNSRKASSKGNPHTDGVTQPFAALFKSAVEKSSSKNTAKIQSSSEEFSLTEASGKKAIIDQITSRKTKSSRSDSDTSPVDAAAFTLLEIPPECIVTGKDGKIHLDLNSAPEETKKKLGIGEEDESEEIQVVCVSEEEFQKILDQTNSRQTSSKQENLVQTNFQQADGAQESSALSESEQKLFAQQRIFFAQFNPAVANTGGKPLQKNEAPVSGQSSINKTEKWTNVEPPSVVSANQVEEENAVNSIKTNDVNPINAASPTGQIVPGFHTNGARKKLTPIKQTEQPAPELQEKKDVLKEAVKNNTETIPNSGEIRKSLTRKNTLSFERELETEKEKSNSSVSKSALDNHQTDQIEKLEKSPKSEKSKNVSTMQIETAANGAFGNQEKIIRVSQETAGEESKGDKAVVFQTSDSLKAETKKTTAYLFTKQSFSGEESEDSSSIEQSSKIQISDEPIQEIRIVKTQSSGEPIRKENVSNIQLAAAPDLDVKTTKTQAAEESVQNVKTTKTQAAEESVQNVKTTKTQAAEELVQDIKATKAQTTEEKIQNIKTSETQVADAPIKGAKTTNTQTVETPAKEANHPESPATDLPVRNERKTDTQTTAPRASEARVIESPTSELPRNESQKPEASQTAILVQTELTREERSGKSPKVLVLARPVSGSRDAKSLNLQKDETQIDDAKVVDRTDEILETNLVKNLLEEFKKRNDEAKPAVNDRPQIAGVAKGMQSAELKKNEQTLLQQQLVNKQNGAVLEATDNPQSSQTESGANQPQPVQNPPSSQPQLPQSSTPQPSAPVQATPVSAPSSESAPTGSSTQHYAEKAAEIQEAAAKQIVRGVQGSIGSERSHITMRLVPETLGRIHIQMTMDGGMLTAQITAQKESTQVLLQESVHSLRSAFEEQGIKVDRLVVNKDTLDMKQQDLGRHEETQERSPKNRSSFEQRSGQNGQNNQGKQSKSQFSSWSDRMTAMDYFM